MIEIRIIAQRENPLFKRKEIAAEMSVPSSPKIDEVEKIISEKISVPAECVKIKKIRGNFGTNLFNIIAFAYDSKEDKDKFEIGNKAAIQPAS
ncbi:hypothetical protein HY449_00785 [Candidatus Pacearchaeota archaeon]|nr:hypothetical protein [Candidatus Pacearchaeota archaeon]